MPTNLAHTYNLLGQLDTSLALNWETAQSWLQKTIALYGRNLQVYHVSPLKIIVAKRLLFERLPYGQFGLQVYRSGLRWLERNMPEDRESQQVFNFERALLQLTIGKIHYKHQNYKMALESYLACKSVLGKATEGTLMLDLLDNMALAYLAVQEDAKHKQCREQQLQVAQKIYGKISVSYIEAQYKAPGCKSMLETIKDYDLSWDACSGQQKSLLNVAISAGDIDALKYFDLNRTQLSLADSNGKTPLMYAAESGQAAATGYLLARKVPIEVVDNNGLTPLMYAAMNSNITTAQLIAAKAKVGCQDHEGNTALIWASVYGQVASVKTLIKNKADITIKNKQSKCATWISAYNGQLTVLKILCASHPDAAKIVDGKEYSLLHAAAMNGQEDVIAWLLNNRLAGIERVESMGATALLLASLNGYRKAFGLLLTRGAQKKAKDNFGRDAIIQAAYGGHVNIIAWLIDQHGFDIHSKDNEGVTPLLMAAWQGHIDCAKWLIENGANLEDKSKLGRDAIILAAEGGHVNIIEWLIDRHGFSVHSKDKEGLTPLLMAVRKGHLGCTKWLAEHGANLTDKDKFGGDAVLYAAGGGHVNIIAWLIDRHGFSIHSQDNEGVTPLLMAAWQGHLGCTKWLAEHGANLEDKDKFGRDTILKAAQGGHVNIIEWLIDQHGFSIHSRDSEGLTPLLMAIRYGHLDCAKWLVEHSANLEDKSKRGRDAIINAAYDGHVNIIEWLIDQHGFSIHSQDNEGKTPLLMAIRLGHLDCAKWLVEHSANLEDKSKRGRDAIIQAAAGGGNVNIIAWLIGQHGFSVHSQDNDSMTPLLMAVWKGHLGCAKWLAEHGASLEDKDKLGRDAVLLSAYGGHANIIAWLIDRHGFSVHSKDNEGLTPLLIATWQGHLDCAKWLVEHGANIKDKDYLGFNAQSLAELSGHKDITQWLTSQPGYKSIEQAPTATSFAKSDLMLKKQLGFLQLFETLFRKNNTKIFDTPLARNAQKYGLICKNVPGDGNCFFHAVFAQLPEDIRNQYGAANDIRAAASNHIVEHIESYRDFIPADNEIDLNKLVDGLYDKKKWANHLLILATSRILGVTIAIVRSDNAEPVVIRQRNDHLAGHQVLLGYEVGIHYQILRYSEQPMDASLDINDIINTKDYDDFDAYNNTETKINSPKRTG